MKFSILLLLLQCFEGNTTFGQQSFVDSIKLAFDQQRTILLQEKIYVQTDKRLYLTSETIWFKIYNVDASFHQLMDVSRIAYVELLSADHKPALQVKVELNDGMGDGFLEIPASLVSGNYTLRAYTSWMKNFSPDFYFERTLAIVNPSRNYSKTGEGTGQPSIQFFPEGGNLVNGLESRVGFAAKDMKGKGIQVKGAVINQANDTITQFHSLKFGLGQFNFTPVAGSRYKVICYWNDTQFSIHELPKIFEEGYVMRLEQDGDKLSLEVNKKGHTHESIVYLLVQTRQQLKLASYNSLQNGKASFTIDKNQLAEGVSQITLFNSRQQPVCERLYFKQPEDTIGFLFQSLQNQYRTREKIEFSVSTRNNKDKPIAANAAISIFLLDSLQRMDEAWIATYFYLTSELKGRIDSPNYYLSARNAEVIEAGENLMLTNGWRRFKWEDVVAIQQPAFEFLPEVRGHIVNAKLVDRSGSQTPGGITAYLSVPGDKYSFTHAISDRAGRLRFETTPFYGAGEVVAQTNYERDSSYRVDIMNPFSEKVSANSILPLELSREWEKELTYLSTASQVSHIYKHEESLQFLLPLSPDSSAFFGKPDNKYFLDDYTRFSTMEEVLREYVTEVQVRRNREKFNLRLVNQPYKLLFETDPLVLIDGVPIFDMNKVIAFDPLKVKKLEVVTRKFYHGRLAYPGILSYTTYQGDLGGYQLDPNAIVVRYDGLQIGREFYSPVYETIDQQQSRLPDFRTTLFWSGRLPIPEQSNAMVNFFTSDMPGRYLVVVEGITADGKPGSGQWTFTVSQR